MIAASGLALALGAAPTLGAEWEYGVELYALAADVKATLAKVFDKAIHSDKVTTALSNTLKAKPYNLGPDGTFKMLSDGVKDIKTVIDAGK